MFTGRDKELILKIPLSDRIVDDGYYWLHDNKGSYSIRNCYRVLQGEIASISFTVAKDLELESRAQNRNFMWRVYPNCLPTATLLRTKRPAVDSLRTWRQCDDESIAHVLLSA
ncbi:conserved hypothetical protein [Ricinus communis]|uniref:Uncharacterized protein n=1 Tax=Ricinus communis TaxID=3988 RepID=B9S2L7_RICCO|nr:conserved hypothetical protein [Ricinus communis]